MNLPFVSILIPIRNEAAYIERCLDAVISQDYPLTQLEVLIADGMSDDGTRELIAQYAEEYSCVKLFDNPGKIVAKGLNLLTPLAKGEILIRVDGHCVIASDYVRQCVAHITDAGVDGVGGPMRSIGEDDLSVAIALAMSSKFGVGGSSFRTESGKTKLVDTVPFPAYTHTIIEKVGMYDEELVRDQDDEYNYRIRKEGGKVLLAEDVHSTYYSRGSLRKLWQQFFQYGFWKVRVLQKHPKQMRTRQFTPPVFVFALAASLLVTLLHPLGWVVAAPVYGGYLLLNSLASFAIGIKNRCRKCWLLPIIFAIIHIGYGLGFLVGLVKFWNRWRFRVRD